MEKPEDLLSIGQLSKICQVSVKTLRHYDQIGLVKAVHVNPVNQYRFYEKNQVDLVNTIKLLKVTGFSLAEIRECVAGEDRFGALGGIIGLLTRKETEIAQEIEKLQKNKAVITAYKELFQNIQLLAESGGGDGVSLKNLSARTVVSIRNRGPYNAETFRTGYNRLVEIIKSHDLKTKSTPMAVIHHEAGKYGPAVEIYLIASPGCRPCQKNLIEIQAPVAKIAVDSPR